MARVEEITLYLVKLPLSVPYHVSYRVYEDFDPILVEARDSDGRLAWGEGHISPGYSDETVEGGWDFCKTVAARMVGRTVAEAKAIAESGIARSPVAATSLVTAMEMLEDNRHLRVEKNVALPLLTPFHSTRHEDFPAEVEARVAEGFRTLKIKVGKDVEADIAKVRAVQKAARGKAILRLDANRGFSREDGCRFASTLDPEGIESFEQPCKSKDWEANAAVAKVSTVPVMLDESIYGMDDIERVGTIEGIGAVKLKVKKLGGIDRLEAGLKRIREIGMVPILGDGVAADIGCWVEACVARSTIDNAGEFNGFLKPKTSLLKNPLEFQDGALQLKAGYVPEMDRTLLKHNTVTSERFTAATVV
jgi:L-alanine-DL-glutamate epimerase-like enolase superfamily enzyme